MMQLRMRRRLLTGHKLYSNESKKPQENAVKKQNVTVIEFPESRASDR